MAEDPTGLVWLMTRKVLGEVCSDAGVRAVLAAGHVFVIVRRGPTAGLATPFGHGAGATPTASFASVREMAAAVDEGDLPERVGALLYDPEHWSFTPPEEQQAVEHHVRLAAEVARSHGLTFIATPAVTLTRVLDHKHRLWRRPDRYQAYLDLGIARMAADADVVDVQAQNAVRDTKRYAAFVGEAVAQVLGVNPAAVVLAGLSTNPPGEPVDERMLARAMTATIGTVAGWWLNVPSPGPHCPTCNPPRPDIGVAALRAVFG